MGKQKKSLVQAMNERNAKQETDNVSKRKEAGDRSYLPPSRQGKEQLYGWYSEEVCEAVGILAVKERKSKQDLLGEALNLLFLDRGLPPIA